MSDGVFNIAKGKVAAYVERVATNDPATSAIVLVLLKTVETDATIVDYDTLAALLAGSNTEADFTNYARKVMTDSEVTAPTPDDTNNWQVADLPDKTWTSAGGTTDNTLAKMLVCYDPDTTSGSDSDIVPLCYFDFNYTTDGTDLQAVFDTVGFYKAA